MWNIQIRMIFIQFERKWFNFEYDPSNLFLRVQLKIIYYLCFDSGLTPIMQQATYNLDIVHLTSDLKS